MHIRQAKDEEYSEIYKVVKSSFATAEHSDGLEQDLILRLKESKSFIPELSLIAIIDSNIVGHILFTMVQVGESTQLALAPLAVLPDFQKRGIGKALIEEGHKKARELGYNFSILLGSENYYPRFGYKKASDFGIVAPFDVPDENFMAVDLQGNSKRLEGIVKYDKAFNIED